MKKISILFLFLLILTCLTGCKEKLEEEIIKPEEPLLEDTVTKLETLDELNETLGSNLVTLSGEKENEEISLINNETGVYSFEKSGMKYVMSVSKDIYSDLTGLYQEGEYVPEAGAPVFHIEKNKKVSRFAYSDMQYVLILEDDDSITDLEFMELVYRWLYAIGADAADEIKEIAGTYYEETRNGSMQISFADENSVYVSISIPEDEDAYNNWSFKATVSSSKLVYESSQHFIENYKTNESVSVNDGIGGFMEMEENKIRWTGSGNVDTSVYIFNKD